MTEFDLPRRVVAEAFGTGILVATVVGSGIMADQLTDDTALALLANATATAAILVVLIAILAPISGAHLNPAVSLVFALRGDIVPATGIAYACAQLAGGIVGVVVAHAMFGLPLLMPSSTVRSGGGQWISEIVASFGLLTVILAARRFQPVALPWLVGLFILGAYWFTASTSFANPAVALARAFTESFAGIRLLDVPGFVLAELLGALVACVSMSWLLRPAFR